jgi:hypothetical protein
MDVAGFVPETWKGFRTRNRPQFPDEIQAARERYEQLLGQKLTPIQTAVFIAGHAAGYQWAQDHPVTIKARREEEEED